MAVGQKGRLTRPRDTPGQASSPPAWGGHGPWGSTPRAHGWLWLPGVTPSHPAIHWGVPASTGLRMLMRPSEAHLHVQQHLRGNTGTGRAPGEHSKPEEHCRSAPRDRSLEGRADSSRGEEETQPRCRLPLDRRGGSWGAAARGVPSTTGQGPALSSHPGRPGCRAPTCPQGSPGQSGNPHPLTRFLCTRTEPPQGHHAWHTALTGLGLWRPSP